VSTWLTVLLAVVGSVVVASGLVLWMATERWHSQSRDLRCALTEIASSVGGEFVDFAELERLPLPDPVLRYFRWAVQDGQPLVRIARVRQVGQFLLQPDLNGWSSFTASQLFTAQPPGFVWDAGIRMAPLVTVRVRDAYDAAGAAGMDAKIASLVTVMSQHATSELDAASLQRFLAEAVWLPTALLPSENLTWSAIDDCTAQATLADPRSEKSVSLQFRFGDQGEIVEVYTPCRFREVDGQFEPTPWTGSFRAYEEHDGMMIPMEGDVAWQLPAGPLPYWKGRLVDVEYEFASPE